MWNLSEWYKGTYLQSRNRLIDIGNKLMVTKGERGDKWEAWNEQIYSAIYKIRNKDLLYSTGNYSQYLVIISNGKESENLPESFPGGTSGKESACQCGRRKRLGFSLWAGEIPWRRKWRPTPVFLPGKFHGWGTRWACGPWDRKEMNTPEWLSTWSTHTHTHTHTSLWGTLETHTAL